MTRIRWVWLTLSLSAMAALLWLGIRSLSWGQILEDIRKVSPPIVILSFAFVLIGGLARAYRWQLLFLGQKLSLLRLFRVQNEGIGANNLVPIGVVTEAVQLAILTLRDRVGSALVLATLGVERVVALLAGLLVISCGFLLIHQLDGLRLYGWGVLAIGLGLVGAMTLAVWLIDRTGPLRKIPYVMATTTAIRHLQRSPRRLLASFAVSVFYWILMGVAVWLAAVGLGLSLPLWDATLATTAAITLVTVVPLTPAGLGTFELAMIFTMGLLGVDKESAFSLAIVVHAMFVIPPTTLAILLLPAEGVSILGRQRRPSPIAAASGDLNQVLGKHVN